MTEIYLHIVARMATDSRVDAARAALRRWSVRLMPVPRLTCVRLRPTADVPNPRGQRPGDARSGRVLGGGEGGGGRSGGEQLRRQVHRPERGHARDGDEN